MATAGDVEAFLEALATVPGNFLDCRSMKHNWQAEQRFTVIDTERETSRRRRGGLAMFAERTLVCTRCGMERNDAYQITSSRGHTALRKVAVTYTPPEGYYVKGAGRISSELLLGAQFERDTADVVPISKGRKRR